MADDEDRIPLIPMTAEEFARAQAEARAQALMAAQDLDNRIQALVMDELTTDQLHTLMEFIHLLGHNPVPVVTFWEGRLSGILAERHRLGTAEAHDFVDDAIDLDNPYCAWEDRHGTKCNLPPGNGRHHRGEVQG